MTNERRVTVSDILSYARQARRHLPISMFYDLYVIFSLCLIHRKTDKLFHLSSTTEAKFIIRGGLRCNYTNVHAKTNSRSYINHVTENKPLLLFNRCTLNLLCACDVIISLFRFRRLYLTSEKNVYGYIAKIIT